MSVKYILFVLCLFGWSSANDVISSNETQIQIYGAFSDVYYQWITEQVAIILTVDSDNTNTVYRTVNSGASWTSLRSAMQNSGVHDNEPTQIEVSPVDKNTIFVRGLGDWSWSSTDMGATWNAFQTTVDGVVNGKWVSFEFHHTVTQYALAAISTGYDTFSLIYSTDLGKTWTTIYPTCIGGFSWGDAGLATIPTSAVYFVKAKTNDITSGDFVMTTDWGKTTQTILAGTSQFLFLNTKIMALVFQKSDGEYVLQVSDKIGFPKKKFYEATFPFGNELENNAYSIIEDHTGAVYMGVNHDGRGDFWGNVYESNARGDRFAVTLLHVSENWPLYDFEAIHGLDGIYLSNIVSNWNTGNGNSKSLRSVITFDNGGQWQSLTPPRFDMNGKPLDCTGTCALHLHGISGLVERQRFGPFYSSQDAVGLILATGNTGPALLNDAGETNTYLSRDGGLSWIELWQENTIYEFGDHGGIIVLAPFETPTTKIYYTKNQKDVFSYPISDVPVTVSNIRTDPDTIGERFMIIGSKNKKGVIISLDFSKIFSRDCVEDDYEMFDPTDGKPGAGGLDCLMGRQVSYRRRKANAECFNAERIEGIYNITACPCRETDWECDEYYVRNEGSGECVNTGPQASYPPADCEPGDEYNKTAGYRLVAGTYCVGGVDHWGKGPYKCPSGSKRGWIAAVVIVVIVVLVIVGMFFASSSEWVRDKLPFMRKIHGWKAGYLGMGNQPDSLLEEDFDTHHRDDSDDFTIGAEELEEEKDANVLTDEDSFNPRA